MNFNSTNKKRFTYSTISINKNDLVSSQTNNLFRYAFPVNAQLKEGDEIAVSSVSIFNSFFNIKAEFNNNTFQYRWYTGSTSTLHNVILPDGNYSFADINNYLVSVMITNLHYLIDAAGNFVYYLQINDNLSTYTLDITHSPIPTSLPLGWTQPVGAPALPVSAYVPEIIIPDTNITRLFGFNTGTYPIAPVIGSPVLSQSQNTPQITDITSILLATNMINSPYSNPTNVMISFPIDKEFGEIISPSITELVFNRISAGYYEYLDVRFIDNQYRDLQLQDENVVVTIVIRSKN